MNRILYISPNCPVCDRVLQFIAEKKITCRIVNIEGKTITKRITSIVPALFVDQKLIAYGEDIFLKLAS